MNEKKSVKVLEVFDSLEISGGVQAVVMNVFRVIDHDIVQMDFAVYQNPKENSYHDEIEFIYFHYHTFTSKRKGTISRPYFSLWNIAQKLTDLSLSSM